MAKYSSQLSIAVERRAPDSGTGPVPKLNGARCAEPIPLLTSSLFGPVSWARSRALGCQALHARGCLIFTEGQAASGVYLVEKGTVKLTMCSGRGRSLILGFFGPQTVLGLPAAILGARHEVTAEAVNQVATRFLPREDLLRHLRQPGDAGMRAVELLSQMVYSTLRDVEVFWLTDSVEQKLARFLLSLCPARYNSRAPVRLALELTHEDISQRIGVSRETVTRFMSRFKKRGVLNLKRSMLTILDPATLDRLADGSDDARAPAKRPRTALRIPSGRARPAELRRGS
jgi:CRP/FNR family transcriptional regulator, cyclic AMP receptor protein